MSLVHLASACSHLQNASKARLGLTSLPRTNQLHHLLLNLQRTGYVSNVTIGGTYPPPPSPVSPIISTNPAARTDVTSHTVPLQPYEQDADEGEGAGRYEEDEGQTTQANIASRRLWIGLKYYNNRPVLEKMALVSKPTRRVWMSLPELEGLCKGERRGYVKGLRGIGEAMFVSTDRGIMEIRECVERRVGGMLLCRINHP